jgi:phosphoribosylamine-glycine ligase
VGTAGLFLRAEISNRPPPDPQVVADDILNHVIPPTVEAAGFSGLLGAGMMMTAGCPKVLEFNVRLGDRRRSRSCTACSRISSPR